MIRSRLSKLVSITNDHSLIVLLVNDIKHLILLERDLLFRILCFIVVQSLDDGHVRHLVASTLLLSDGFSQSKLLAQVVFDRR